MIEKTTLSGGDLWKLRLDEQNPRHEPKSQQQDIINYLAANEDVLPLLQDIAEMRSLNPFDRFGAIRDGELLIAIEGNRRLCSLILLNDPDLAPAKYRARVRAAAEGWDPGSVDIDIAVFDSRDEADPWLERRHQGALAGRGLRQWSPAAKDRHFGESGNALALKLLDDGLAQNLITPEQRQKRVVTTVRRFSDRVSFRREYLRISTGASDPEYVTDLTPELFKERLRIFLWGLFAAEPTVHSRMSAKDIENWVRDQLQDPVLAEDPVESSSDAPDGSSSDISGERSSDGPTEDSSGSTASSSTTRGADGPAPSAAGAGNGAAGAADEPGEAVPPVPKPAPPASRWSLVDGGTFATATNDPVRRHVIYELSRITRNTPLAAAVVARVLLEGLYLDFWHRTCVGKADSKLHVKVLEIVKVIEAWSDLTRAEKNALNALQRSAQNPGQVLSPAALGAAAHGAAIPAWSTLVAEWDTLLPVTRRIFAFVESGAGQAGL
ncbi:hypothetical protein ILP86_01100 [Microbacterium sp. R1]|uniref:hypothetical protein n=1 Tax=Microbacterium sp. R1 TaxID=322686 RepID=UPI00187D2A70|nr:hypothetical protein [Microbacterium sp. R1]MBE7952910.1 hypothetical protein [Microbacterium sp. R1]